MPESPLDRFLGLMILFLLVQVVYISVVNHDLLVHRMSLKRGTEKWDWLWSSVFKLVVLAIPAVAALDARSGRALLPSWTEATGFVLFLLGGGLFLWAMGENPFFEATVRIQSERGHRVIATGPYRSSATPAMLEWWESLSRCRRCWAQPAPSFLPRSQLLPSLSGLPLRTGHFG